MSPFWLGHQGSCAQEAAWSCILKAAGFGHVKSKEGISGRRVTQVRAKGQSISEQFIWPDTAGGAVGD